MKNKAYMLVVSFVCFLLFFIFFNYYNYGFEFAESDYKLPAGTIDCYSNKMGCKLVSLKRTIEYCDEWYEYQNIKELNCSYTIQGTDKVNLISDPANHIKSKWTDERYNVEILRYGSFSGVRLYKIPLIGNLISFLKIRTAILTPWDMEFLPDGSFLITRKDGKVLHLKNGHLSIIATLPVINEKMAGLLGLAVHPEFDHNGYIYLFYTYSYDSNQGSGSSKFLVKSRISRFTYKGVLTDEAVILDDIPGTIIHSGGRLGIGPDGKLYATTGVDVKNSQNISLLSGKILRINLDGSIPEDNPFNNSYTFSYGHRNPQGLAWDENGQLYASEHGPWRYDELNKIEKGGNYGWAIKRCDEAFKESNKSNNVLIDPIFCFKNYTLAPSGMAFVNDRNQKWHGDLFVAGLRGEHLHKFDLNNGKIVNDEIFYVNAESPVSSAFYRRLRDVEYFNGSLWVLSDFAGIIKITPD